MSIENFVIADQISISDAMKVIDQGGKHAVLLQDASGSIVATLSDGDIRRYLLQGGHLKTLVNEIAQYNFIFSYDLEHAKQLIEERDITLVPILTKEKKLRAIVTHDAIIHAEQKSLNLPLVIQAGGKGTRLYPYTEILPKPLIPIGNVPISELIINKFLLYGCSKVFMIVNNKKNLIKAYFGDRHLCEIIFLDEMIPLGTGGGLKLLDDHINTTFFMTNCDILVDCDYYDLYCHHKNASNLVTMVCVDKTITVPYGTITLDEKGYVAELQEKPSYRCLTNTGLYVIEPNFLSMIPQNQFIHITDIIDKCIRKGYKIGTYIVEESQWSDMGQLEEMEKMKKKLLCAD